MGKLGAGALSSSHAAELAAADDSGNGGNAVDCDPPSPATPTSPIAPSTPSKMSEVFKRLQFRKNKTKNSCGGGSNCNLASPISPNAVKGRRQPALDRTSAALAATVPPNAKELRDHVAQFTMRSDALGAFVVAETAVGWILTAAAPTLFDRHFRLRPSSSSSPSTSTLAALTTLLFYLAWGVLRACSYIRTVILMHDLVHGVVFTSRRANSIAAAVAGFCAWTSAANFGRNHRRHHARLGVEEELEFDADHTVFWTVKEWNAWQPSVSKLLARSLRDPVVYHFVSAPAYLLFFGSTCPGYGPGLSTSETLKRLLQDHWMRILGVVGGFSSIARFHSVERFWAELAAGWLGLIVGAAIFGLQHDAVAPPNAGYRAPAAEHSRDAASLMGSTYIPIPRWISDRVFLGIEHHHIHHLDSRVPCYHLFECHVRAPPGAWEAAGVPVLRGWGDIARGLSMSLWDEERKQFARFPPLVKRAQVAEAWAKVASVARERLRR